MWYNVAIMTERTPFDLGAVDPATLPEVNHQVFAIDVDSDRLDGQQTMSASFVRGDGSRPNEILIQGKAWSASDVSGLETASAQLVSRATGLDVISIGIPGMAYRQTVGDEARGLRHGYNLTERQIEYLGKGAFMPVGEAVFEGVRKVAMANAVKLDQTTIHLLNYSMANSTAAGMLASKAPELANTGIMMNVESAGLEPDRPLGDLASAFTSKLEQEVNKGYEAENPLWVPRTTDGAGLVGLMRNIARRPRAHYYPYKAMAIGKQVDELRYGTRELDIVDDVDILFVNGDKSEVSRTEANARAAEQLGAEHEVWPEGYHSECNRLEIYIGLLQKYLAKPTR